MREAGNEGGEYNLQQMLAAAEAAGVGKADGKGGITGATGFGGEFLLTPIKDIEKILEHLAKLKAPFGIQTNGTMITERHIDLFKKYGVSVGMSVDGPEELNDWRVAKVDEKNMHRQLEITRKKTEMSIRNLNKLLEAGISTSLIITLSKFNGETGRLIKLVNWLEDLSEKGLKYLNIHMLEVHNREGEADHLLSQWAQVTALRFLRDSLKGKFKHISPFDDIKSKLTQGQANCVWNHCSPYSTPAVTAIGGHGEAARCGRLNTDGVTWERSMEHSHERYIALYMRPMELGGCGGCKFFTTCGGQCPGEGEGYDWRAKTIHCKTLYALMEDAEKELMAEGKEPVSLSLKRPFEEWQLLSRWSGLAVPATQNRPHGDAPHGDAPHGDHTDASGRPIRGSTAG
jgi:uncharacterized protein